MSLFLKFLSDYISKNLKFTLRPRGGGEWPEGGCLGLSGRVAWETSAPHTPRSGRSNEPPGAL